MSVAFRRESDEEHKEPRFELPLPPGPNVVTRRGLAAIEARVEALEIEAREASGDELEAVRRDLRYWHTRRTTAQVTIADDEGGVCFGSRVTFKMAGETRTIEIVGDDEADPAAGLIAFSAPLAHAMIGAEVGERVPFNGKTEAIIIVSIEPLEA